MCDVDEAGERTCFALAESGAMCAERTMCPPGEQCEDGACAEITTLELDSGNAPQSAVGEPCYETSFCEQGLFCRFASDEAVGECAAPPRAEAPCASDRAYAPNAIATICDWTSYCADDGVCRVLPPVGTECAVRNDGKVPVCNSGGYCDTEQGLCLATKGANEACSLPTAFSTTSGVPLAPECDETQNLRCVCLAEHASCGPGEGVCRQGVRPGGSCAFETAMCLYGSQCLGGVCDYP
jgi:hypothetical protein